MTETRETLAVFSMRLAGQTFIEESMPALRRAMALTADIRAAAVAWYPTVRYDYPVSLVREPDNAHDPSAIAVWTYPTARYPAVKLGYVPSGEEQIRLSLYMEDLSATHEHLLPAREVSASISSFAPLKAKPEIIGAQLQIYVY